jgi:hypothetical protein
MDETTDAPSIEASEPLPDFAAGARHTSRHRAEHARHGAQRRKSQRLMLAVALGITVLLLILVIIFSATRIGSLTAESNALHAELFQTKQELAKAVPALDQARKELAGLAKGRLPHLQPLVPDKVIDLGNSYVKNVVFTVLHKNGETQYEYRVVMENKGEITVHPDARIFVFDQRGIQVGMAEIADHLDLLPGESRAYSSVVDRFLDEEPRYFYLWTRGKQKAELPLQ